MVQYHSQKKHAILYSTFPHFVGSSKVVITVYTLLVFLRINPLLVRTKRTSKHNWMTPKRTESRVYARARVFVCVSVWSCARAIRRWYVRIRRSGTNWQEKAREQTLRWRRDSAQTLWRHTGYPLHLAAHRFRIACRQNSRWIYINCNHIQLGLSGLEFINI